MADGLVINTNIPATAATASLKTNNTLLQKSLDRLSSGSKINLSSAGVAVSMKMVAALQRNQATKNNTGNAVSFLQTQDGAMSTVAIVLQRISELKLLNGDSTKSTSDKANYDTEFLQLTAQIVNLQGEKFNGVSVFSTSGSTFDVITSDNGTQIVTVTKSNASAAVSTITDAVDLDAITVANTTTALEIIATLRAQNGAETNRLDFASEMLTTSKVNLEAANSRIKDTDIAAESTSFAKYNILMQSGTAMLTQANIVSQAALRLLS